MIITIDGPTASGKSTIAHMIAQELGFFHLNSGLLFRACAYLLVTKAHYSIENLAQPKADDIQTYLDPARLHYVFNHAQPHVLFDGIDITAELKKGPIDQASSIVSAYAPARQQIIALLRALAQQHDIVVDGRDTGSVIFPDAALKFYLTASLEARAHRWLQVQKKLGIMHSMAFALEQVRTRDVRDMERSVAPLIIPAGAHVIDNSRLSQQETVDLFLNYINQHDAQH